MRFEVRDRPYDLYAVIGASALLVLVILVIPDLDVLRIILGLPFILFFPGYVLISALYPERKRYFDEQGNEVPPPSDEDEEGEEPEDGAGEDRDGKKKKYRRQKDNEKDDEEEKHKGKGLDGLERVALSLGLSIAITPLIGLLLNYTYDWAPDTLGIRLIPILISQFAFISIVGAVAVYRRNKTPPGERFAIIVDLSMPEDQTTMDKVLTVGIVIMMVLSVGMLVYIIVVPREGEAFTELYILGNNHKAENYPGNILLEDEQFIYIGIGNHEHRDLNYTLVLTIDPSAENETVGSFDPVTISRNRQPSMEVRVPDDETLEIACNFSVLETGSFKLRVLLFLEGKEYRDNHIWIRVFQDRYLKTSDQGLSEAYLAGRGGDPSLLPSAIGPGEPLILSVGARNDAEEKIDVNITITIGDASNWIEAGVPGRLVEISETWGAYYQTMVNSSSSFGPRDLSFALPGGDWVIRVVFSTEGRSLAMEHRITAGGSR